MTSSKNAFVSTWNAFCSCISECAERDGNIAILGSKKIIEDSSTFLSVAEDKIFIPQSGEENIILNAAGLALAGKIPWILTYSGETVVNKYNQIRSALAQSSLPVRIAVSDGGLSRGERGFSCVTLEDIALMRTIPTMHIFVPSDSKSARGITEASFNIHAPMYIRLGQTPVPVFDDEVENSFVSGGARLISPGTGVTICACGIMVAEALKASSILEQQGISAEIIDCYSIKPLPEQILLASVRRTGCCVTAEEHSSVGGLGSSVAECLARTYPIPVRFVAVEDQIVNSGLPGELREYYGLTWKEIVNAAAQVWALRRR